MVPRGVQSVQFGEVAYRFVVECQEYEHLFAQRYVCSLGSACLFCRKYIGKQRRNYRPCLVTWYIMGPADWKFK